MFEKGGKSTILMVKEGVKFIPFGLVGNENIDQIVDVGDRGGKNSQSVGEMVVKTAATPSGSDHFGPGIDGRKAVLSKDFEVLTDDYFRGGINDRRQTKQGINKGGGVDMVLIVSQGMENRIHFEMSVGEGIDGNFKGAFKSGTIGTDMEFNRFDGGH